MLGDGGWKCSPFNRLFTYFIGIPSRETIIFQIRVIGGRG